MQYRNILAALPLIVVPVFVHAQQGEVIQAFSARPGQQAHQGVLKSVVRTHFIHENLPQTLPVMDDFSIDRTRKRWAKAGDDGVSLDATVYRLSVNGMSDPDMAFSSDTTFLYIVDLSDPDTIIVTVEPLPEVEVLVRDLSVYPPMEALVTAWPPYTLFDTLSSPLIDTIPQLDPPLIQDSLLVYRVAPDPRTCQMGGSTVPLVLWEDDDVFVNDTYPVAPPTIGVATFDGLSRTGLPYDFSNYSSYGIADRLTSVPIDMQLPASDSVYLSFYVQARGLSGDAFPQPQDSLVLEFYAPDDDEWYRVWRSSYPNTPDVLPFRQVIIPIREFRYLRNGFRMRFLNYATLSGSFDHWHLDYVRLAAQRRFDDTTLVDVAYVAPESSLLQTYTSVPFNMYQRSPASYMAQAVELMQRNLDDQDRFITYGMQVALTDGGGAQGFANGTNTSGNAASVFSSPHALNSAPNNFQYDASLSTDAAFWRVKFWTNATPDVNRYNDTTSFVQELSNYYAYDDGTAEMGYGLNAIGGKLAYRFDLIDGDSLRAVRMYFNPIANQPPSAPPTQGSFLLTVWRSLDPEVIIHQNFSFSSPEYREDGLNKFVEYPLDSTIWVDGTIYVGWTQTNSANMNLGFDRNRDNSNKVFFKTGVNWQQTQYSGSLMMRPVFVAAVDPFLSVQERGHEAPRLSFHPNPATDRVWLHYEGGEVHGAMVECMDATGRLALAKPFVNGTPLSIADLGPGAYVLRIVDSNSVQLAYGRMIVQD